MCKVSLTTALRLPELPLLQRWHKALAFKARAEWLKVIFLREWRCFGYRCYLMCVCKANCAGLQ